MNIFIYGDSLLKFVLWENGRYVTNHEPVNRFSREYRLEITNRSYFGSCVDKGLQRIRQDIGKGMTCDYAVIEFGGNDCAFDWKSISDQPDEPHDSVIPLQNYLDLFRVIIHELREAGIRPILTNLLPFDPRSYLNWVTRSLDRKTIELWLGEENRVYRKNELYSHSLEQLARTESVPLVDLRSAFLEQPLLKTFYCDDGVHPNRSGQELIYRSFAAFVRSFQ